MKKKIEVNMNEIVSVKLTDYGSDVLFNYDPSMTIGSTIDNEIGVYTFELWQLMAIFGKSMYHGASYVPFENNSIIFELDIKKKDRADIVLREDDFRLFYKAYPKKKAPGQAEKTWNKLERLGKLPDLETLFIAIHNQVKEKQMLKASKKFCPEWPHPSTWLNARSWENEIEKPAPIDKKWDDPDEDEISDVPY